MRKPANDKTDPSKNVRRIPGILLTPPSPVEIVLFAKLIERKNFAHREVPERVSTYEETTSNSKRARNAQCQPANKMAMLTPKALTQTRVRKVARPPT